MTRKTTHKLVNAAQTLLLVGVMALILGGVSWFVWGAAGLIFAAVVVAVTWLASQRITPKMVLRLYGAQVLGREQFPQARQILNELARRAQLRRAPELYVVASEVPNAFAVGDEDDSAVALTVGLIQMMNLRELAGVLGHEVAHIENGDLRVMALADSMSRVARALAFAGFALGAGGVALLILGLGEGFPWICIPLLILAPTALTLAQLALSRTREFDADFDGAELSGDPAALASALEKLERRRGQFWEDIVMPGRRIPEPSMLRTHPPTVERVERLSAMIGKVNRPPIVREVTQAPRIPIAVRRPRFHWSGAWY